MHMILCMSECLFCRSDGPFTSVEHIIPESLGNDDLVLRNEVCDQCQNYFGREVEKFVLEKTPIAFWRTFLGIRTKKGHDPAVDISQPAKQTGRLPSIHPLHDDIAFSCHPDGSCSVDIDDPKIIREICDGDRKRFNFVLTPKVLQMFGRFLCKIGIELICSNDGVRARHADFDACRDYSKNGHIKNIWPIFYFTEGDLGSLRKYREDAEGLLEDVVCYTYSLVELEDKYTLFRFAMGTDHWIVCLNNPFPTPEIREAFPGREMRLIWYPSV